MEKLKCAILLPTESEALPTWAELEDRQTTKVLYGLGKYDAGSISFNAFLPVIARRFLLVQSYFSAPYADSEDELELVIVDDTVDEVIFQLAYGNILKCKFLLDEIIAKDIFSTSWKLRHIYDAADAALAMVDNVNDSIDSELGEELFQEGLPHLISDLNEYATTLTGFAQGLETHLKEIYSRGWQ